MISSFVQYSIVWIYSIDSTSVWCFGSVWKSTFSNDIEVGVVDGVETAADE